VLPLAARLWLLATVSGVAVASTPPNRTPTPAPSVHVRVVRESGATDRAVLLVHVEASGVTLGSYQGTMTFDPAVLMVDSALAGRDGFRFVNANNAAKGSIRFAGFTATGFKGTDAVRIVARTKGSIDGAKITATLEVAGDMDGRAIAAVALQGTKGVESAARAPAVGKRP
jgi:hypothetical protein